MRRGTLGKKKKEITKEAKRGNFQPWGIKALGKRRSDKSGHFSRGSETRYLVKHHSLKCGGRGTGADGEEELRSEKVGASFLEMLRDPHAKKATRGRFGPQHCPGKPWGGEQKRTGKKTHKRKGSADFQG